MQICNQDFLWFFLKQTYGGGEGVVHIRETAQTRKMLSLSPHPAYHTCVAAVCKGNLGKGNKLEKK